MTTSQISSAPFEEFQKYAELPLELRLHVVEELTKFPVHLAPFASVNSEWNRVIERVLFREVRIDTGEAKDFGRICSKRQNLLHQISLNLESWPSFRPEDLHLDQGIFMDNISELLHVLSSWSSAGRSHRLITLSIRILGIWTVESLIRDFRNLPDVTVIGKLFTMEQEGCTYHIPHSTVDALHKKLPNLSGASIALPSGVPLQQTIHHASSKHRFIL